MGKRTAEKSSTSSAVTDIHFPVRVHAHLQMQQVAGIEGFFLLAGHGDPGILQGGVQHLAVMS